MSSETKTVPTLRTRRERLLAMGGVAIALFGLDALGVVLPDLSTVEGPIRWLLLIGPHWTIAGVVVALVLWGERRALASIGLERPTAMDVGWGMAAFVVGVLAFGVTRPIVQSLGLDATGGGIETLASLPLSVVVVIAITAGVTEEVLYRGYPIERLTELTGDVRVGAGLTLVVFTVAHVPFWGVGGALQIGAWTVVVTVLYVRRRNLVACILMHVCNDLFAFVVLPALFGVP
jgi:membrane protease YdiL (CAAX protease family)